MPTAESIPAAESGNSIAQSSAIPPASTAPAPLETPDLEIATWSEIQAKIEQLQGKIVVIDLWSTSCIPCLREFPKLVELQRRHPAGLRCLAVSLDYLGLPSKPVEDYRATAKKFLDKHQPPFATYLCATPDSDVHQTLQIASLPAVLVFDADGNRVATITEANAGDDGFDYAQDVIPLVDALVHGLANR